MAGKSNRVSDRKQEHIELCLTDKVSFVGKSNGFEHYDFLHYAITEVDLKEINFSTSFLKKKISYPFIIACMTGGTAKSENINAKLAVAANDLNIPMGVGSQRQALENKDYHKSYKIIRKNAPSIPLLGNLGAAQLVQLEKMDTVESLIDLVEADAMIIHVNPLQELLQENGEPSFTGLLKKLEKLIRKISVPVIIKEVGAGISGRAAEKLLSVGVKGIDVAGAGGTSWASVELLRSGKQENNYFRDWGLPTSYCLKNVFKLKKKYEFTLIGSGGINSPYDAAKAFALGADCIASARIILQELDKNDIDGVKKLITGWFAEIKNIMFLTGSQKLSELHNKIILKEKLY